MNIFIKFLNRRSANFFRYFAVSSIITISGVHFVSSLPFVLSFYLPRDDHNVIPFVRDTKSSWKRTWILLQTSFCAHPSIATSQLFLVPYKKEGRFMILVSVANKLKTKYLKLTLLWRELWNLYNFVTQKVGTFWN